MPPETPPTPTTELPSTTTPAPELFPPQPKLRKQFLWAFVAAVVISGAIVGVSKLWPKPPAPTPTIAQVLPTPTPAPLTLTLTSPSDGELAVNQEVIVEGLTAPAITVVIFTEGDEVTTESDASGKFSTSVTLATGINTLVITAFSDDGEEASVSIDIVYDA